MTDGRIVVHNNVDFSIGFFALRLDEAGADGTGSADDEHRLSGDFFAEGVPVGLDVGAEHGYRALGDVLTDELI